MVVCACANATYENKTEDMKSRQATVADGNMNTINREEIGNEHAIYTLCNNRSQPAVASMPHMRTR